MILSASLAFAHSWDFSQDLACSSVGCSSSCPTRWIRGVPARPCFSLSFHGVIVPWSQILSDLRSWGFLGGPGSGIGCNASMSNCPSGIPNTGVLGRFGVWASSGFCGFDTDSMSRVSVDTPCLNGHHGLAGHY